MAKRSGTHYVLSAQLLDSGAPAYLTAAGLWSAHLQDALPVLTDEERDALLAQAAQQERIVCDPYFFDVRVVESTIDPLSARERIRALGPTTRVRRPDAASTSNESISNVPCTNEPRSDAGEGRL
jgi:hypothetical protein